jgi:hypothetical protein
VPGAVPERVAIAFIAHPSGPRVVVFVPAKRFSHCFPLSVAFELVMELGAYAGESCKQIATRDGC